MSRDQEVPKALFLLGEDVRILHDGERAVALDALEDPKGLGKDGFPTELAFDAGPGPWVPAPARAAYLTAKRLRKRQLSPHQWELTSLLASEDDAAFVTSLRQVFSNRTGRRLGDSVRTGDVPSP